MKSFNILIFKSLNLCNKGFTLLEILLVVAAMSILASIVILAINPAKQLADARNAQRLTDVNTIINAVYQYAIDNNGTLPSSILTTSKAICVTGAGSCTDLIDLTVLTLNEKYLVSMPKDPKTGSCPASNSTCYEISKSVNNRITVSAPLAENSATISVTK